MDFKDILKELRANRKLSQIQLSRALNLSAGNISDWECGRTKPGYDALIKLCSFFDVSADFLLGLSENKPTIPINQSVNSSKQQSDLKRDNFSSDLFYNRLRSAMTQKNFTARALERECELANATIKRWQTQSPSLESVTKVANTLNISIDYLVYGSSLKTTSFSIDHNTTSIKTDLLKMFDALDDRDQKTIFNFVEMLYQQTASKKESTYSTYTDEKNTKSNNLMADDIA